MKLGTAPLGEAKAEIGGDSHDSEMAVTCCNFYKWCNACLKRCCVDEKSSGNTECMETTTERLCLRPPLGPGETRDALRG